MLIDKTYFIKEINIPGTTTTAVANALNGFIEDYEPVYLQDALGYSFMKLFLSGLEAEEQRWIDLRDGAEFVDYHSFTQKWTGLLNDDHRSPIARFVYFYWMRDSASFTSTGGEVVSKPENSNVVSSDAKVRKAHFQMREMTRLMWNFLLNKKDEDGNRVYHEFDMCQVKAITFEPLPFFQ